MVIEQQRKLDVEVLAIGSLKPYDRNPRTHPEKQINQIAKSIRLFGFTNPVLVDSDLVVIAGHGRIEAAKLLGIGEVPTIRLDHMTEAQKRAYVIADNRLAENAGWDRDLLALELQYLSDLDLDFDATITGFETAEIDVLIQGIDLDGTSDRADEVPEIDESVSPVTRVGDLWKLGDHRLLCADATKAESLDRLLNAQQPQMVLLDPPYNVRIDAHVCGLGAIKHREFQMAAGEMSEPEFIAFL